MKCIVKDCENHKNEGGFAGDVCLPCYEFITTGKGIYSQMYRNTHPVKELTDEEIMDVWCSTNDYDSQSEEALNFAKAILRKAQEQ